MTDLNIIAEVVQNVTGVDFINNKSRKRAVIDARVLFGALAKRMTKLPFKVIGDFMQKDHTSIVHYCKVIGDFYAADKHFKRMYDQCIKDLEQVAGGDIQVWFEMNYHLKKYTQLKEILDNG